MNNQLSQVFFFFLEVPHLLSLLERPAHPCEPAKSLMTLRVRPRSSRKSVRRG